MGTAASIVVELRGGCAIARDGGSSAMDAAGLCEGVRRGDARAIELFYREWFDRCLGLAARATRRDEAFCLDVVQDAMLRVVRRLPRLESEADVSRWMRRVVMSCAIDRLRREARRARHERRARGAAPGGEAPEADRFGPVRAMLESLDADDRALLMLRYGRELTLEGAGSHVGLTGDAAHGRIRRALRRLRAGNRGVCDE
ncbi:MAG: sigma-70 family RNA polymerase sigma factor [Phycisphaeraceae bacterium]|nr:sigma-70 family RNA polymerase sigma factor [Phycisphaeraceae bacterium]